MKKLRMYTETKLMKHLTRAIVLMIVFVLLYIFSLLLYSVRFWPDIYNYLHPNITIKRIPTISELNLTKIEVDYVTEQYYTTDGYLTTDDGIEVMIDDVTEINDNFEFAKIINKRYVKLEDIGIGEQVSKPLLVDYFFDYESPKYIRDTVDERKLTTSDPNDVEVLPNDHPSRNEVTAMMSSCHGRGTSLQDVVFPWIAAIFIKNGSSDQFDYYCDGALLSGNAILTAARCVSQNGHPIDIDNVIAILGKKSLQGMTVYETVVRIRQIITHKSFTNNQNFVENDLAILKIESTVAFNEGIRPVCLDEENGRGIEAATVGWAITGELTPIYVENRTLNECTENFDGEKRICASYGFDIETCPSFGGIYVTRRANTSWYLHGIASADPTIRGLCFSKSIVVTSLNSYIGWIKENLSLK